MKCERQRVWVPIVLGAAALIVGCGARSDFSVGGSGGASASTKATGSGGMSTTWGKGASGGEISACPAPREPSILVTEDSGVRDVKPFGPHVYWITSGAVRRIQKCGGSPETLAESVQAEAATVLFVTADGVFWQSSGASVRRVGHAGGDVTLIDKSGEIWGLHVDSANIYYFVRPTNKPGGMFWLPVQDGERNVMWSYLESPGYVGPLVGNDSALFIALGGNSPFGPLRRIDKTSALATEVLSTQLPAEAAADANAVYATFSQGINEVRRMDIATGRTDVIASAQPTPQGIATDERHVYWGNSGDPTTIQRTTLDGGVIEVLVDHELEDPRSLALDDEALYWGDWRSGIVGWMAKPQ